MLNQPDDDWLAQFKKLRKHPTTGERPPFPQEPKP
jgi:hypothetical protein